MTGWTVDLGAHAELLDELRAAPERLAILLATPDEQHLRIEQRITLDASHVEDHGWHVQLTDAGKQHVLSTATHRPEWLVEAHSHGRYGDPARFSPTDLDGLDHWVPHLRWRLPGRGYAALVIASVTIDGLLWTPDEALPAPVEQLQLTEALLATTQLSFNDWNQPHDA